MKKLTLLLIIALAIVSCEGPMGPQGLNGKNGQDGAGTTWKIINLSVAANDWQAQVDDNGLNRYYTCSFDIPEITQFAFDEGGVFAYIKFGTVQQVLPYVRHYENGAGLLWTETYDFDYSKGKVNFYVTLSDFAEVPPTASSFRLVVLY